MTTARENEKPVTLSGASIRQAKSMDESLWRDTAKQLNSSGAGVGVTVGVTVAVGVGVNVGVGVGVGGGDVDCWSAPIFNAAKVVRPAKSRPTIKSASAIAPIRICLHPLNECSIFLQSGMPFRPAY